MKETELQLYSNTWFDLDNPDPSLIEIEDIAHALSLQCRFTGHCNEFYSVAQHSIIVASILPDEYKFFGLMHDAHEAYVHDVASPMKTILPDYNRIEDKMWRAVATKYSLPLELPSAVKEADRSVCLAEKNALLGDLDWGLKGVEPADVEIVPWAPALAEQMFLLSFDAMYRLVSVQ